MKTKILIYCTILLLYALFQDHVLCSWLLLGEEAVRAGDVC